MEYFKHPSNSLSTSFMFELIQEHGGNGYLVYFGLIEIITKAVEIGSKKKITFDLRYLKRNFHLSIRKIISILTFCSDKVPFKLTENDTHIEIDCSVIEEFVCVGDLRVTVEYKRWRNLVLERDQFTCTVCGSKKNIVCHHIKKASTHPYLIYSVDNGLILCQKCHVNTHKKGK